MGGALIPEEDVSLRPAPWRRMAWVIWRQHRIALGGAAVALGALAVYGWIVGLQLHHAYVAAASSFVDMTHKVPGHGIAANGIQQPVTYEGDATVMPASRAAKQRRVSYATNAVRLALTDNALAR